MITTLIKPDVKARLDEETKRQTLVLPPGYKIDDDTYVLSKIGAGGRAHSYFTLTRLFPNEDIEKQVEKLMPFHQRSHYITLLKTEENTHLKKEEMGEEDEKKANSFSGYIEENIKKPRLALEEEIKQTAPARNYSEVRALTGSPYFDFRVIKHLPASKIKEDPESEAEFKLEYALMSRCHHKNIPKAFNFKNSKAFGMEYDLSTIDGKSLEAIMNPGDLWWKKFRKTNPNFLPAEFVIATMHQFYSALSYLHKNNIYYPDINLGNVMVDFNGTVNLIDFGFAEESEGKQILTNFGGEERTFPPEIISHLEKEKSSFRIKKDHQLPLNLKSNVYSGGVLTYFLMNNVYPFESNRFSDLTRQICNKKHVNPARDNKEYSRKSLFLKDGEIDWLIDGPLQKLPEHRPTASQLEIMSRKFLQRRVGDIEPEEIVKRFMDPLNKDRIRAFTSSERPTPTPKIVPLTRGYNRVKKN